MINDDNIEDKEEEIMFKNDEEVILSIPQKETEKKTHIIYYIFLIIIFTLIIIIIILLLVIKEPENTSKEKEEEETLKPLIFNSTSGNHTHTIIFMPGFSNTPENFINVFTNKIKFSKKNDTTIIILRSPLVEVTAVKSKNYSWFDVYDVPITNQSDYNFEDLKKSAKILENVINSEVNLLQGKYENIIIGGHSQGGFISLYQGYNTDKNLGGLFIFSAVLPPGNINPNKDNLETYYGYGDADEVISPSFLMESIERIRNFKGFHLHLYKGHKHYVCTNETKDVSKFLDNLIK